jgi:hypothetical protein
MGMQIRYNKDILNTSTFCMHLINCWCDLLVIVFHLLILYDHLTETIFLILLSLIDLLQCLLLLKPEKRFVKCTRHKRL